MFDLANQLPERRQISFRLVKVNESSCIRYLARSSGDDGVERRMAVVRNSLSRKVVQLCYAITRSVGWKTRKEYRIDRSIFLFFFFKFLSFLYPPFNAAARSVFEASDPRESGAAKQVTRKFCDVPETFDESARHSNPQLPLILKAILSLSPSKDVFVERCARVSFSARFRDTLALKSWWRLAT